MPESESGNGTREIALAGGHHLQVESRSPADAVRLIDASGRTVLSVLVTPEGPVLRFEGASLLLQAAGTLSIEAERLQLHGRGGVSLSTDGDLSLQAAGNLDSEARVQNVTATLGNVNLRANDDVKMTGERVRMNC